MREISVEGAGPAPPKWSETVAEKECENTEISFLSGCTVLAMSFYSFVKSRLGNEFSIDMKISIYLGIRAIAGRIIGKQIF